MASGRRRRLPGHTDFVSFRICFAGTLGVRPLTLVRCTVLSYNVRQQPPFRRGDDLRSDARRIENDSIQHDDVAKSVFRYQHEKCGSKSHEGVRAQPGTLHDPNLALQAYEGRQYQGQCEFPELREGLSLSFSRKPMDRIRRRCPAFRDFRGTKDRVQHSPGRHRQKVPLIVRIMAPSSAIQGRELGPDTAR